MSNANSAIGWTDATWNPVTGCTKIPAPAGTEGSGCDNCYAHTLAHTKLAKFYLRQLPVVDTEGNRSNPFAVRYWPGRLDEPFHWRTPRLVFVNSMSDLFHRDVPSLFIREVFGTMMRAPWHTYQVLTKRPARALRWVEINRDLFDGWPVPRHIWIGASIEAGHALYRVDHLRRIPATVRFLSCEPLLGSLAGLDLTGIHWVIGGGESGAGFRAVNPDHARELRDLCAAAGVPFFWKQWGGRTPKSGGHLLDGIEHNAFPSLP